MAGSKEIRSKIKSVQNTRKITKAMEMVAASKMRKAQERMQAARPYSEKIRRLAANLSHALMTDYRHPFLTKQTSVKRVGLIVITTDKGLCGGLNTNVLRQSLNSMRQWEAQGISDISVTCIGNKGLGFMHRLGAKVMSHVTHIGDTPHMEKLIGPIKVMLDAYQTVSWMKSILPTRALSTRCRNRQSLSLCCHCLVSAWARLKPVGIICTSLMHRRWWMICCCAMSKL